MYEDHSWERCLIKCFFVNKKSLNFYLVAQWKGFWNYLLECLFVSCSFKWESVVNTALEKFEILSVFVLEYFIIFSFLDRYLEKSAGVLSNEL